MRRVPSLFAPQLLDHTFQLSTLGDTERCARCGEFRAVHPEHAPDGRWALPAHFQGSTNRKQKPRLSQSEEYRRIEQQAGPAACCCS